jgi:metal-dependent hydrolase (beta-lactamase superfamily II)
MIQNSESRIQLIVWNVGQGQWVTIIYPTQCLHFDVGGETAPFRKVIKSCKEKSNKIFLSHGDWDHLNKLNFFNKLKM